MCYVMNVRNHPKNYFELELPLSGPGFFRYRKDSSENWRVENILYAHVLPLNFVKKNFSFEGVKI